MSRKTTGIVAYLTWIGFLIAFVAGDRKGAEFHLNQSLVIMLVDTARIIISKLVSDATLLGWLVDLTMGLTGIFCLVCWFIGIIGAIRFTEYEVPMLGKIRLLK